MAPPDLNEYMKLFGGLGQAAQADNPWAGLESGANTVDNQLYRLASQEPDGVFPVIGGANLHQFDRANRGGRALQAGLVGLISGGIGGVGQNLGKAFVNNQTDLATQAMRDMQSGNAIAPGLSPSVFSAVKQQAAAQQMADAAESKNDSRKLQMEKDLKSSPNFDDLNPNNRKANDALKAVLVQLGADPEQIKDLSSEDAKTLIESLRTQRMIPGGSANDPESLKVKMQVEQQLREGLKDQYKNMADIQGAFSSALREASNPHAASDVPLIEMAVRAFNPGASARQGTILASLEHAPGNIQALAGKMEGVFGGSRLTADVKKEIVRGIAAAAKSRQQQYNDMLDSAGAIAQLSGGRPEALALTPRLDPSFFQQKMDEAFKPPIDPDIAAAELARRRAQK